MKKIISLLLVSCLCLEAVTNRYGGGKRTVRKKAEASISNSSSGRIIGGLDLGIEYYKYEEPKLMKIYGPMMSFYGDIGYSKNFFKVQVDGYFSTHLGANRYHGALQGNGARIPYNAKSTDWYVGINTKIGVDLLQQNKELLFVYIGLGYRFLHNFVIDNPGISASYHRYQGYLYLPIGIKGEIPIKMNISLLGEVEYRVLLFGHNTSGFKRIGYDDDLHFIQNGGQGVRVAFGPKFYFSNGSALRVKAYYDYWFLEDSNIVIATQNGRQGKPFVEPKNNTIIFGVSVGYSF